MKTLTVTCPAGPMTSSSSRGCWPGRGSCCRAALPRASRLFVVTDSNVGPLYLHRLHPRPGGRRL